MFLAADDRDRNGLQLEKVEPTVFVANRFAPPSRMPGEKKFVQEQG